MKTLPLPAALMGLVMLAGLSACDSKSANSVVSPITPAPGAPGGTTPPAGGGGAVGTVGGGTGSTVGGGLGGVGSGTGTIVNALPVALPDVAIVQVGSTANLLDVLVNDADANGDALTITAASLMLSVPPASGDIETIAGDRRSLRYTPPAGFVGVQTLSYTISDGKGGVSTSQVVITVSPLKVPSAAVPDAFTLLVDAPASTLKVLANDIDGAGGGLVVSAASSTLTVPPSGNGTVSVVNGALRYQPRPGFIGVETLSYTLRDANGATATALVVVTVLPIAAPPVALPDVVTAITGDSSSINVIANDVDLAGGGLTVTSVAAVASVPPGSEGSFTIVGNRVRYTPASATFVGVQTATYTITDSNGSTATGLITIVVTPAIPPVPPIALPDVATRSGGATTASLDVLANDIDVAGGGLTITAASVVLGLPDSTGVSVATDGAALQLTLPASYVGVLTLSYTITDANGSTSTAPVVVTVAPAALPAIPPVPVPDVAVVAQDSSGSSIDVLANDIDPAAGGLTLTAASVTASLPTATHALSIVDEQVRFVPAAGFAGVVAISYTVTDARGSTASTLLTVTVTPSLLGTVPPVTVPDVAALAQDGAATLVDVLANDIDAAGGGLTVSAASVSSSLPPATHAVAVSDNRVQFTPAAGFVGVVLLSYTATDSRMASTPGLLTVTVTAALPIALPLAVSDVASLPVTLLSGSTGLFDVLANDIDPAGGGLTLQNVRFTNPLLVTAGSVLGVVGNQLRLTVPLLGLIAGVLPVEYTAVDSLGRVVTGLLQVTVAP